MNACGQHNMSSIGFQGMSINSGKLVALYKYAWWWNSRRWKRRFSDKVIKIQVVETRCLRFILNDFEANGTDCHFRLL
jgi:sulfite reductase (ferredoxin)